MAYIIDIKELDEAIRSFGRAVTETAIPRPERVKAEAEVRDFLLTLRGRIAFSNGDRGSAA